MSVSDEVPEQWHPYFKKANFESFRDVAAAAGVSPSTVIACLKPGRRMPTAPTVEKVASALRMTPEKLHELRGDPKVEPFKLPSDADHLGLTERKAILETVLAFSKSHARELEIRLREAQLRVGVIDGVHSAIQALDDVHDWAHEHLQGETVVAIDKRLAVIAQQLVEVHNMCADVDGLQEDRQASQRRSKWLTSEWLSDFTDRISSSDESESERLRRELDAAAELEVNSSGDSAGEVS